jgi:hypothetical protein
MVATDPSPNWVRANRRSAVLDLVGKRRVVAVDNIRENEEIPLGDVSDPPGFVRLVDRAHDAEHICNCPGPTSLCFLVLFVKQRVSHQ